MAFSLWLLTGLLAAPLAQAQQPELRYVQERQDLVNWYYAATYGTGVYTTGDRTVAVLQLPLSYTLREPEEDRWGMRITLPVSIGFYDYHFDDILDEGLPQGLSTMSFVPGLELEKQITSRWRLKPYVSAGAGNLRAPIMRGYTMSGCAAGSVSAKTRTSSSLWSIG